MFLPGSGNYLQDRLEREMEESEAGEDYCPDCNCDHCRCDEVYEQSKERTEHGK